MPDYLATAATLAALRAKAGDHAGAATLALGYHAPRDGGGGLFVWEQDTTTPDDGGLVVVPDDPIRSGCWRRALDEPGVVSVRWFGAKGDGVTDDLPAFVAAVHALPNALPPWGVPDLSPWTGPRVRVPAGYYKLGAPWVLDRQVTVDGDQPLATGQPLSRLACAHTGDGIVVQRGARLAGLYLGGAGGHGVYATSRVHVERCTVSSCGGHGIWLAASYQDGTNCDGSYIANNRVELCGRSGIEAVGADANACTILANDCVDNGEWGYDDRSFLGNTLVGCHAANNGRSDYAAFGAYRAGSNPNTRSILVGCYAEGDWGARVLVDSPSMCLGGFAASSNIGSGFALNGAGGGSCKSLAVVNAADPTCVTTMRLGSLSAPRTLFEFEAVRLDAQGHEVARELPYRWQYNPYPVVGTQGPAYELLYGNIAGGAVAITGRDHPYGYAQFLFAQGLWLGPRTFERSVRMTAGAPTDAATSGSLRINYAPAPGEPALWARCASGWSACARCEP